MGAPWPFPDGVCHGCLEKLLKTPEYRERLDAFGKTAGRRTRAMLRAAARSTALKVLDFADRIAAGI